VKLLLDVCVSSRSLDAFLAGHGHDVLSAFSVDPKASDEQLMEMALREDRVLVTEDKDFGELIFVRHLPHGPVVRVVELTVIEQVQSDERIVGPVRRHIAWTCDRNRHARQSSDSTRALKSIKHEWPEPSAFSGVLSVELLRLLDLGRAFQTQYRRDPLRRHGLL
jgi:predicted nuclease of predicted toxin-antitoxin system